MRGPTLLLVVALTTGSATPLAGQRPIPPLRGLDDWGRIDAPVVTFSTMTLAQARSALDRDPVIVQGFPITGVYRHGCWPACPNPSVLTIEQRLPDGTRFLVRQWAVPRRTPRTRSLLNSCLQRNPFRPVRSAAERIPDGGCLAPHPGAMFDGLGFWIVARGTYAWRLQQSIVQVRDVESEEP